MTCFWRRLRDLFGGKAFAAVTGAVFLACCAVATPVLLGLGAGLFWRAFRWVNGWLP